MKINFLKLQEDTTPVEGIEVHVERVDKTVAMIVDNYCDARSSVRLPCGVRLDAIQPGWTRGNVINRREVNILATVTESVQGVEVV